MNARIKNIKLLFLVAAVFFLVSCKKPVAITYGTGFNNCVGYCKKELLISDHDISYVQQKNGDHPEVKKCTKSLNKGMYDQILTNFDFQSFEQLDTVIGCPDCADGGAEWLELKDGKKKKRVTFEYNHVPEKFKDVVERIRKLQAEMEDCKSKS